MSSPTPPPPVTKVAPFNFRNPVIGFNGLFSDYWQKALEGLGSAVTSIIIQIFDGAAGQYSPVHSALVNLESTTAYEVQWSKVGNYVQVSGQFLVKPTDIALQTSFEFDLPWASDFRNGFELGGDANAVSIAGQSAGIVASIANNTASVQWIATDTSEQLMSFTLGYYIKAAPAVPLAITIACPFDQPELNEFYAYQFTAQGGVPPYAWSISSGALPTGLNLNGSTGLITGTPSASGSFPWEITVRDFNGTEKHLACTSTVDPVSLTITYPSYGHATEEEPFTTGEPTVTAS